MSNFSTALLEMQDADGAINEYSIVRIRNLMNKDFRIEYANRRWDIKAGGERTVPYHCMVMVCGDPRSFDVPGDMRQRYRTDEWRRLRILYGVYDDMSLVATNIPKLEVMNLDGVRIETVLDNPDNLETTAIAQSEATQVEELQNMLKATIQRMKELEAQMNDVQMQQQLPPNPIEAAQLDELRRTNIPSVTPLNDKNEQTEVPVDGNPTVPVGSSTGTLKPPAKNVPNIVPSSKMGANE